MTARTAQQGRIDAAVMAGFLGPQVSWWAQHRANLAALRADMERGDADAAELAADIADYRRDRAEDARMVSEWEAQHD